MGRDAESYKLDFAELSGKWFVADEAGVSRLKREVRIRAKEYLYLRKGEDFGCVIQMLFEAWNSGSVDIQLIWDAYSTNLDPLYDLSNISLNSLLDLDLEAWLWFYNIISKRKELLVKSALAMDELLTKTGQWVKGANIKILCCEDEINLRAGLGWRALGCEIRRYRDEKTSGSHRFYLSERE
ncbi:MAG TPA: hypothetical protein ENG96_04495, partial [Gammaproteobacteria bacterium]|nr:hypothetical protein [Gammaproteobacteria bacterium]